MQVEQRFELAQFGIVETLAATEDQLAQVLALVAQAVAGRVGGTLAVFQAQVTALVLVGQVEGTRRCTSRKNRLTMPYTRLVCSCMLNWRRSSSRVIRREAALRRAGKAQALKLGSIEIYGAGRGGRDHLANL